MKNSTRNYLINATTDELIEDYLTYSEMLDHDKKLASMKVETWGKNKAYVDEESGHCYNKMLVDRGIKLGTERVGFVESLLVQRGVAM